MQANEEVWLNRAKNGDPAAFGELVEAYQDAVFNLCFRMLGDPYEAEDAAQEAFIRAYKAMDRYDSSRPFSTWLLSIAAHHSIDRIRRRKFTQVSMDAMPYQFIADPSPGPEASLSATEQQERVQALLDNLSPTDRAAVVMFYWYELSYDEIAEALDLTNSAVKSRLHRARRTLAESWEDENAGSFAAEKNHHESPAF